MKTRPKNNHISLCVCILLFITILIPLSALANHRDNNDGNSWWEVSSSTERKINKLDDDPVEDLFVPILFDVKVTDLDDTWGDARSNGRTHEGIDIFAPRGAWIVSPTDAVVTRVDEGELGGNIVYTANPGGETFYYAHLDSYAEDLDEGDELEQGDIIGYVGNSGNAQFASPHLHFTIYDEDGASNPFPRLTEDWTVEERIDAIENIINDSDDEEEVTEELVLKFRNLFIQAQTEKLALPDSIEDELEKSTFPPPTVTTIITRDVRYGMQGDDIQRLQNFLITKNLGVSARTLASTGTTGYFGTLTKNAVVEYQKSLGLSADGVVGPRSRVSINGGLL